MSERPTPETDAAERMAFAQEYIVPTDFARRLERERDEARNKMADALQEVDLRTLDYLRFREAIIATLEENRHLADGDDCTLAKLKSVVPEWK